MRDYLLLTLDVVALLLLATVFTYRPVKRKRLPPPIISSQSPWVMRGRR